MKEKKGQKTNAEERLKEHEEGVVHVQMGNSGPLQQPNINWKQNANEHKQIQ